MVVFIMTNEMVRLYALILFTQNNHQDALIPGISYINLKTFILSIITKSRQQEHLLPAASNHI